MVFLLVIVPAARSFFDEPAPPDTVTDAATALGEKLRDTPGIATSSVSMQLDGYGGGGSEDSLRAWRIAAAETAPRQWSRTVRGLRAVPGFGTGALRTVTIDAAVSRGADSAISAISTITAAECRKGTGTEVVGSVTLPISDIADTADPAYNAIVASWNRQGYTSKDRAGPLELRTGGPLRLLAISGGPRGITITATSY